MGPSTGVSLTPPRRRREQTSSTRFRVATSMRWKFIVPTRTCRICSLLRFDGKKWCFSPLSDSSSPLPFPDRSFFDRCKRSASIQMTGPSHAACNNGCDLYFRWDRYRDAIDAACYAHVAPAPDPSSMHAPLFGLRVTVSIFLAMYCSTAVKVDRSCAQLLNCAVGRAHRDWVEWVRRQLDPPARSDILVAGFCLKTCTCRQSIEPSRGECQALRARPEWGVCTLQKQCSSPAPTSVSHSWKQETPTTTTLNSANER